MYLPIMKSILRPVSCWLKFLCGSKSTPPTNIVKTDIIRLAYVPKIGTKAYKPTYSSFLAIRAENPLSPSEPLLEANPEDIQSSDIAFQEFDLNSVKIEKYTVAGTIVLVIIVGTIIGRMIYNYYRSEHARGQGGPLSNVNNGSGTVHSLRFDKFSETAVAFASRPLPPGIRPNTVVPASHPLKSRKGKGIASGTISAISLPKRMPTRQSRHVTPPNLMPNHQPGGSKFIEVSPPSAFYWNADGTPRLSYEHTILSPAARKRRVPSLACDQRALRELASNEIKTFTCRYENKLPRECLLKVRERNKADKKEAEKKKAEGKNGEGKKGEGKKAAEEEKKEGKKAPRVLSLIIEDEE